MALNIGPVGVAPSPPPEAPKIYSDAYKHSIVDSVYQNENSFLSTVRGTPVLTEYYRNVIKAGEEPHAFQPGSGVYQQYTRIKKTIIKFIGEDFQWDEQKAIAGKTGSAYVIFGLAPIKGDLFIADIGDGNAGWFTLTSAPTVAEFTANKVYKIEFALEAILSKTVFDELNSYVIEELVYSRDQHLNGGTPIITQGEFDYKESIQSWVPTICQHVMANFYWDEERTLSYKNGSKNYYDPYLTRAFLNIAPQAALAGYPRLSTLNIEYGGNRRAQHGTFNIWDVLFRNDWNLLRNCKPGASVVDVLTLWPTRLYANIRSSFFDGVIVTNPEDYEDMTKWVSWVEVIPGYAPLPVQSVDYIFSKGFYTNQPAEGFEKLVVDILKNNIVDLKRLNDYLEGYFELSKWQQLYYAPILLLLISKSRKMGKVI